MSVPRIGVTRSWAAGLAAAGAVSACDPCAGVVSCSQGATASAEGRVIDFENGAGQPGVRVAFRRQGGPLLAGADSLVAVTNGDGIFQLRGATSDPGVVTGALRITPQAPRLPYDVGNVQIVATTRRGDGSVLTTNLIQPYVAFVGAVVSRRTGAIVAGGTATFVRTGGIVTARDTISAAIDFGGRFYLPTRATTPGLVVGTLTLSGGPYSRPYVLPNTPLAASVVDFIPDTQLTFSVGTSVDGDVLIIGAVSQRGIAGATVGFQRTGGLALASDSVTAVSDSTGHAHLPLTSADESTGTLVGRVTVRVGSAAPIATAPFSIPSADAAGPRTLLTVRVPGA